MRLLPVLLVLCACGDPLVEGDWRGPPLLSVDGLILADDGVFDPAELDTLRVAAFWARPDTPPERPERGLEQTLVPSPERSGRYGLHNLPPAGAMLVSKPGFELGLARLLAYDPRRSAGSCPWAYRMRGGAEEVVLAWRRGEPPADLTPWLDRLFVALPPDGLSLLSVEPRANCVWDDDACRWTCSRCPDRRGARGRTAAGPPQVRLHRAASPGRFRPPCFP